MAMTVFDGWDDLELVKSRGTNADSRYSIVVYGKTAGKKQYGYGPVEIIFRDNSRRIIDFCGIEGCMEL